MQEIVRKGMRLKKPRYTNVQLRPELYEFLADCCSRMEHPPGVPVFIRGILEYFYDKHRSEVSAPEGGDLDG